MGYVEAIKRHSLEVARLEGAQADEFLRLLKALQGDLVTRLAANSGQTVDAFSIQRVMAETQAGIDTLERRGVSGYVAGSKEAVEMTLDHLGNELGMLSKAFDGHKLVVSLDAAKALADPAQGLLASHFQTSLQRYGMDVLNGVRQELFVGMRSGDSLGDIAARVASKAGPLGDVSKDNATRLVRTEMSQAFGAASHSGLVQASHKVKGLEKTWLHIGSFRCPVCMPLHGTTRPMDGTWTIKSGRKTKQVAHPPAHPNCACRVSGMKASWKKGLEKLGYLDQNPIDPKSKPTSL
jgi:hypothetical protein